jgi:hypothetical protein
MNGISMESEVRHDPIAGREPGGEGRSSGPHRFGKSRVLAPLSGCSGLLGAGHRGSSEANTPGWSPPTTLGTPRGVRERVADGVSRGRMATRSRLPCAPAHVVSRMAPPPGAHTAPHLRRTDQRQRAVGTVRTRVRICSPGSPHLEAVGESDRRLTRGFAAGPLQSHETTPGQHNPRASLGSHVPPPSSAPRNHLLSPLSRLLSRPQAALSGVRSANWQNGWLAQSRMAALAKQSVESRRGRWAVGKRRNVLRVIRGGSWNNTARNCRAAYRNRNWPKNRNRNGGFRVCLIPGPSGGQNADSK